MINRYFILHVFVVFNSCSEAPQLAGEDLNSFNSLRNQEQLLDSMSGNQNSVEIRPGNQKLSRIISGDSLLLTKPCLIVITLNAEDIESFKQSGGDDNFYTVADDLIYYDYLVKLRMDSLNIPYFYTKKDALIVTVKTGEYKIEKNDSFDIFTYFLFDGTVLQRKELNELIDI